MASIAIGFKNIHYKIQLTDPASGTPTYGTDYELPLSVEMAFDPAPGLASFFANNKQARAMPFLGEKKLTITTGDIPPADEARLLGKPYANGHVSGYDTIDPPYVAVSGQITFDDGTSAYVTFYKVVFSYDAMSAKTQEASVAFRTRTLEGRVLGLNTSTYDGLHSDMIRSDDTNLSASDITTFLTTVQFPGGDNTALTVVATQGGSNTTSKVVLTFAKASGASFRIDVNTITALGIRIEKLGVATAGTFVDTTGAAGTTQVVTFTPTSNWATGQLIHVNVDSTVKDTSGVGTTYYTVQLTLS
jgi:phi13 family phage major tail protein